MRAILLGLGFLIFVSHNANAGVEDFVAGGAAGILGVEVPLMVGGAAKAGQPLRLVVEVTNPSSSVQCIFGDFLGDAIGAFSTPFGNGTTTVPWTPPYDMIFILFCFQESGASGLTLLYGRYDQPRSASVFEQARSITGPAPLLATDSNIPAELRERYHAFRDQLSP